MTLFLQLLLAANVTWYLARAREGPRRRGPGENEWWLGHGWKVARLPRSVILMCLHWLRLNCDQPDLGPAAKTGRREGGLTARLIAFVKRHLADAAGRLTYLNLAKYSVPRASCARGISTEQARLGKHPLNKTQAIVQGPRATSAVGDSRVHGRLRSQPANEVVLGSHAFGCGLQRLSTITPAKPPWPIARTSGGLS